MATSGRHVERVYCNACDAYLYGLDLNMLDLLKALWVLIPIGIYVWYDYMGSRQQKETVTDLRGKPRPKRPDLRSKSLGGADRFGRGWIARTPGPARCRLRCSVLVSSVRAASEALTALPNQPYPKGVAVTESTVEQELPLVLSVACREVSLFFPCRIFRDSLNGCKSVLFVIQ